MEGYNALDVNQLKPERTLTQVVNKTTFVTTENDNLSSHTLARFRVINFNLASAGIE